VGPRRRSEFFEEAAREKVRQEKLRRAAHRLVGSLADTSIPGWDTSEEARTWVESLRQNNEHRTAKTESQ
jgi:hypothetical protein